MLSALLGHGSKQEISELKQQLAEYTGKVQALERSQAVIEFTPDGTILDANDNFLAAMGYSKTEIVGRHHSMFVDPSYAAGAEYQRFWQRLAQGEFFSDQFLRFAKGGRKIWIQATYNPILDESGKPYKVVKFASDITQIKENERKSAELADLANALKICQASVMLADNDLNIVYVNDENLRMLRSRQAEIRQELPNFDADRLVGTCVDVFHKQPSHQREIMARLTEPYFTRLTIGKLKFDLIATPWINADGERLGTVVEWQDVTEKLAEEQRFVQIAEENRRVRQALDSVSTNAMIANKDNVIVYMNEAIVEMMQNAEADIRTALPNFSANNLMGQNIDVFHKNPAHQQNLLARLTTTYKTEIYVGGRTFSLVANPIINDDNQRIGTVVEWQDRTFEVQMEKEIAALVKQASHGDLSTRLQVDGKKGFFKTLAEGLNSLIDSCDGVINSTVEVLDAMAHGNLSKRINGDYEGTFAKLRDDANTTLDKLTEIISRVNQSASTVASGADEIAQGNADLSQRTEEQASSLEETAASMEQMTSTVKQNADNAVLADDLAEQARKKAVEGGQVVENAVTSMAQINDASKKIADIIGVIDEIAFQTNLLALNAAVEAARAGEQGRGFAVVAGEVRNLAQRSAEAAKEIKNLIRDSVAKVEDGSALVNQSGETLTEIVEAVEKVSRMIADISIASKEQSSGIEQVNKAITQMDEMTQQNAALVEQASAAGESMAEQAASMSQILSFFTLDNASSISRKPNMSPATLEARRPIQERSQTRPAKRDIASLAFDEDEDWEEF
ncbi:putative methyl-accepting chemotaxis protein [Catenovulum agarivorans DS-2]|uniref:Putative methyl-accepting chemotaxis protein n=1 Tax=Catenovulum agarivorans DS-2 TaxID=1328313 RepID=W7QTF5_9ALTE|nr:methyl-accepting chemotaxis protein [Catenovulum agarivorans]EWH08705.1 putative methyl-accepting chemotaxis protein [Catenovulum agarivorans DS-2]